MSSIQTVDGAEGVAVPEALEQYMKNVSLYPLLSKEEEAEAAAACAAGDKAAREKMINANLRLVIKVARTYLGLGLSMLDLVQEGNIGLIKAVDMFDPSRGNRFSTYACFWIKQTIGRAISDKSRTIRIPVHRGELLAQLRTAAREYHQQTGDIADPETLAELVKAPLKKVKETLQFDVEILSLDLPVGDEGDSSLGDFIEDGGMESPDARIMKQVEREEISYALQTVLDEREEMVVRMRYAFINDKEYTLEEIGKVLGVTRERVRQILLRALKKLKAHFKIRDI